MQMNNPQAKWLVVETRHGLTKKAADLLSRSGIQTYLPLTRYLYEVGEKMKSVKRPLFDSWIFVQISNESEKDEVLATHGVLTFLYWRDQHAVISEEEIQMIRRFTTDYTSVELEKSGVGSSNPKYPSRASILVEENGEINVATKFIKAVLPSLGYTLACETGEVNLGVLNTRNQPVTR